MNKENYRMMKVSSVRVAMNEEGFITKIKKGLCLISLTGIESVFKGDDDDDVEIIMKTGERFVVKNIDIIELKDTLERLNG